MVNFICYTCKKRVNMTQADWDKESPHPHEKHNVSWFEKPVVSEIENVNEITPETTIEDSGQFLADVNEFRSIQGAIASIAFERQDAIKAISLGMLARRPVLFYGAGGVAKSYIARNFAMSIGRRYFEYLIHQGSQPDEMLGPIDFRAMRDEGKWRRMTTDSLLDAHIAFLDEIGNSSSPTRNMLKGILNEGIYSHAGQRLQVPLELVIAASNSILDYKDPTEAAFEDRFLIKYYVRPIQERANIRKLLAMHAQKSSSRIALPIIGHDVVTRLQSYVDEVEVNAHAIDMIEDFLFRMAEEAPGGYLPITDRTKGTAIKIMKANAVLNGRKQFRKADLSILQYLTWHNFEEDMQPIQDWIKRHLTGVLDKIEVVSADVDELWATFEQSNDPDSGLSVPDRTASNHEVNSDMTRHKRRLDTYRNEAEDQEELDAINSIERRINDHMKEILRVTMDWDSRSNDDTESLKK